MDTTLVWLHVVANLLWIGGIVAVGLVLGTRHGEVKVRGAIARQIYLRLAVPAFLVSFVAGGTRLALDLGYYFKEHHFFHGKLLFAVAAIALHHVIGARAKRAARDGVEGGALVLGLTVGLVVCAAAAALFVIFRIPN